MANQTHYGNTAPASVWSRSLRLPLGSKNKSVVID